MVPTPSGLAPAADVQQSDHNIPAVTLTFEVLHGRTRYRERPVFGDRFTIGAGDACDLRLGGAYMPVLHSIVTVHGAEITVESLTELPELVVNGVASRSATLRDGDILSLGGVELRANIVPVGESRVAVAHEIEEAQRLPEEMSALELIDEIEREQTLIDEFEGQQKLGEDAFLEAILSRRRSASRRELHTGNAEDLHGPHFRLPRKRREIYISPIDRSSPHSPIVRADAGFLHDLEQLAHSLGDLSQELQTASLRATQREAGYSAATEVLLDVQQKLASQFEMLLAQVESLRAERQPQLRARAIA